MPMQVFQMLKIVRVYCDGCGCVDCFNNIENEDARLEATETILERNPHAFKPKIYSSPCSAGVHGDPAKDVLFMGIHNKGCCCKRTHCIKKYCECFQANILCSENCKCIDCENLSNNFFEESRKSKFEEFLDANKKDPTIQEFKHNQQESLIGVCGSLPASFVDPHCPIIDSEVGLSKTAHRSLLANTILPSDIRQLCSILVTVSAAANAVTAEAGELSRKLSTGIDIQKSTLLLDKQSDVGENDSKRNGTNVQESRYDDVQEEKTSRPEGDELIFTEKGNGPASSTKNLYHGFHPDAYIKQERLVLSCLRDWLETLSTFGSLKVFLLIIKNLSLASEANADNILILSAGKMTGIQAENLKNVFTKSPTET
ncbi:hypothetical protein K2173_024545 [Erythroxylum novogranatense]|uniref:CRC domain-containing protein n=1 Tax=Erythroxylum novogranatense TaxID=1862640 RepID=A0AAV8SVP3_9ROSI|nr:hypothetical protein K2173_024545 [Erythroxylum novogranatense]